MRYAICLKYCDFHSKVDIKIFKQIGNQTYTYIFTFEYLPYIPAIRWKCNKNISHEQKAFVSVISLIILLFRKCHLCMCYENVVLIKFVICLCVGRQLYAYHVLITSATLSCKVHTTRCIGAKRNTAFGWIRICTCMYNAQCKYVTYLGTHYIWCFELNLIIFVIPPY